MELGVTLGPSRISKFDIQVKRHQEIFVTCPTLAMEYTIYLYNE